MATMPDPPDCERRECDRGHVFFGSGQCPACLRFRPVRLTWRTTIESPTEMVRQIHLVSGALDDALAKLKPRG